MQKDILTWSKWLIVGTFIILVSLQAGKSFVLDEIDFPTVSHTTSQTGRPVYYHSQLEQRHLGTYHPTLYINTLASFIKVFGFSPTTIRVFGAICVLISALLLILILRQLTKRNDGLEVLLLGLYLLNPYTISNATLPDIDPTILPVLLLLFVYVSIKFLHIKHRMDNKAVLILGLLFALVLWSKLTTPLVIPPFLLILALITSKDFKRSLLFTVKVTLIGIVTFVATYFIYCVMLGLSPTYTYIFLVESFTKGTSTDGPVAGVINNLKNIKYFLFWPTIPLVGAIGVASLGVLLDKTKDEATKIKKLLLVTGLLITFFYIALISPFGGYFKYPFPVFGLLVLSCAFFYDRYLRNAKINPLYAAAAVIFGFVLENVFWGDSMFLSPKPFEFIAIFIIAIIAFYFLVTTAKTRTIAASLFLLYLLFTIGFQLSISRIQAIAPYPTKYLYGQTGIDDAAAYIRANTKPGEVIWSMKDIGQISDRGFYESYAYYFSKPLEADLVDMMREGKVRYYVATTGIGQDNIDYYTNIKSILEKNATREKQFGNYVIYKAKG